MNISFVIHASHHDIDQKKMYINYLYLENNDILQPLINSNKYISIDFKCYVSSYENIDILSYANEINLNNCVKKENIIKILNKSVNLEKLIANYSNILNVDIINKLSEKKFIKYVSIAYNLKLDLSNIYRIIEIKSLDTFRCINLFYETDVFHFKTIFEILWYVINNLNKSIKIIIDEYYTYNKQMKYYLKIMTYNFKVNEHVFYFNYIPKSFYKFNNLYDVNLNYL